MINIYNYGSPFNLSAINLAAAAVINNNNKAPTILGCVNVFNVSAVGVLVVVWFEEIEDVFETCELSDF